MKNFTKEGERTDIVHSKRGRIHGAEKKGGGYSRQEWRNGQTQK
jgi:hypothetical protein